MNGDLISRKAVIDIIKRRIENGASFVAVFALEDIYNAVTNLPAVGEETADDLEKFKEHLIDEMEDQWLINSNGLHVPEWNNGLAQAITIVRTGSKDNITYEEA